MTFMRIGLGHTKREEGEGKQFEYLDCGFIICNLGKQRFGFGGGRCVCRRLKGAEGTFHWGQR